MLKHWQCIHCGEVCDSEDRPDPGIWCDDNPVAQDIGHEWGEVERPKKDNPYDDFE